MRLLITGGCGFIGVNLIDFLLKNRNFNLRILDNLSTGAKENFLDVASKHSMTVKEFSPTSNFMSFPSGVVHLIRGDIRDMETCIKATSGIDTVIHLAAHAGVIPSIEDPFFDFEVNALGTLNLLQGSVVNKVGKFIFASSNAPMGNQSPPINEGLVPKPLSPYGASKLACEGYCSAFYESYGLKTVILRFSNAYGPYSLHKNSVIAKYIKDALIKEVLTIYGNGTQTRDFVHVEDLCRAIFLVLMQGGTQPHLNVWGETFHLGTGKESRIIDLAGMVKGLFGDEIEIVFESPRSGEIKRNYSDIGKARKLLVFTPKIKLKDGVKKVYEWFMKQGIERIKSVETLSGSE